MEGLRADVARLQIEVVHQRVDLNKVLKIVVDGNGHSLVSRMLLMENELNDLMQQLQALEVERHDVEKAEKVKVQAIHMAFATAMISFGSSIALILFQIFILKH